MAFTLCMETKHLTLEKTQKEDDTIVEVDPIRNYHSKSSTENV